MNSKNVIVLIEVKGGVIQDVKKPETIHVVIRDYDIDGVPEKRLMQDSNGNKYIRRVF